MSRPCLQVRPWPRRAPETDPMEVTRQSHAHLWLRREVCVCVCVLAVSRPARGTATQAEVKGLGSLF